MQGLEGPAGSVALPWQETSLISILRIGRAPPAHQTASMESAKLLSQGALQMVKFGPLLNARVGYYSLAALPQGLVAAGAACSATTVDNDDAQGVQLCLSQLGSL